MFNVPKNLLLGLAVLIAAEAALVQAANLRVPSEYKTIQAAIDASAAGDTVLVAAGTYKERLRLKEGVALKSEGDDERGTLGLKRAEAVILDGGGENGNAPGVLMAEDAKLDGFTITNVGAYDDALWNKHHATQGNDQSHEHIGAPGTAGVAVIGISYCLVANNIVHHIGYTGIAVTGDKDKKTSPHILRNIAYRNMGGGIGSMQGSTAIIEENTCFENFYAGIGHDNASPLVTQNICYANIRAGIGISEGSSPLVRGNKCYGNRRAGIGVRTGSATRPLLEDNDCYQNDMAGIGSDEQCEPTIRGNRCYENALAGIGCRDGSRPFIVGNKCYRNKAAGIGSEQGAQPFIADNECYENEEVGIGQRGDAETTLSGNYLHHNKTAGIGFAECRSGRSLVINNRIVDNQQVAVGIHSGWQVQLAGNEMSRAEGLPPIVMIFKGAEADFSDNVIRGSGVAGIRTEGVLRAAGNRFECPALREAGPPQFAIWGLPGSDIVFTDNTVQGWRHAIFAEKANVIARGNQIADYGRVGIKIEQPSGKIIATDNFFESKRDGVGVIVTDGQSVLENNRIQSP